MDGVDVKELDRMLQQAFDEASALYKERGFARAWALAKSRHLSA